MSKVLITGSCGLVGTESSRFFLESGREVIGIDNNHRMDWFGKLGDTSENKVFLKEYKNYEHINANILDEHFIRTLFAENDIDLIIHAAGQPSHEKSGIIPFADFQVNALGTVVLLEAMRNFCPDAVFIFLSTNKVYGSLDNDNYHLYLDNSRYRLLDKENNECIGVDENWSIDQSCRSPFGASKTSSDLMVQEYGLYYGLNTVCFRCGCITGKLHKGVEQHGFLSYLCKCALNEIDYKIYGHYGYQVRDNIHVKDLVAAFDCYIKNPTPGSVFNIGGGYENSCSIKEAISIIQSMTGKVINTSFCQDRKADHVVYYTDYSKFKDHHSWSIQIDLRNILEELLAD